MLNNIPYPDSILEHIYTGKRFVASFSTGKDSTLAIYRAKKEHIIPLELITTYNTERNKSWFHGVPEDLLTEVARSINIPIRLIKTKGGDDYAANFEKALKKPRIRARIFVYSEISIWKSILNGVAGVASMPD